MFENEVVVGLIYIYESKFVYFCISLDFFYHDCYRFFHLVRGVPKNMEAFMIVLYIVSISVLKPSSFLSFSSSKVRRAL